MTDSKHTPGPFVQDRYRITSADGKQLLGHAYHSSFANDYYPPFPQADANARLWAAAPELLSALEALGVMQDGYCFCPHNRDPHKGDQLHTGECTAACAAIAKAKGQS
jgi:hypothetical protein